MEREYTGQDWTSLLPHVEESIQLKEFPVMVTTGLVHLSPTFRVEWDAEHKELSILGRDCYDVLDCEETVNFLRFFDSIRLDIAERMCSTCGSPTGSAVSTMCDSCFEKEGANT